MIIPATVDLSEIEDIKEYADKYYSEIVENRSMVTTVICIVKGKINEKLQEKSIPAYESISAYAESDEFASAADFDYELKCFKTASNIFQLERGFETTIFDSIEYVDDFSKIYEKVFHFFMRMQLGINKIQRMESMAYFKATKISVYAVLQMLMESQIGEKEKVGLELAENYIDHGMYKEAKYIVSVFEKLGREEYIDSFIKMKEMITSRLEA